MERKEKEKKPVRSQKRSESRQKIKPAPKSDPHPQKDKMREKVLFITGGDSGIGKAVVLLFAQQGADIAFVYLNEDQDAENTKSKVINEYGRKCIAIAGDITNEVSPCYLFMAFNKDSAYMTGQVLHPNGDDIING